MVDLELTDMALDGDPLGRVDGRVVFAPGGIPGERVRARIVSANRKFVRAEVVHVLRPSPHRVTPACRHFGPCGGCAWQHIAYGEQLRLKSRMLASLLSSALGRAVEVKGTLGIGGEGGASPWGFRGKAHFVFGAGRSGKPLAMGHYRRGSRDLVEVEECPVHPAAGNAAAFRIRDALLRYGVQGADDETLRGVARHVVVRSSERTGETQATLVAVREDSKALRAATREIASGSKAPSGLHLNVNDRPGPFIFGARTTRLHGSTRLREEVAGARFVLSPTSFFQTSVRSAEVLVRVVLGLIPAEERRWIIDLYAGTGLFSIPLAVRGQRVIAVEENPIAVADGIASLRENAAGVGACRFLRARVEDALERLEDDLPDDGGAGPVILDPPREGCPRATWERILRRLRPERVVYVSCNPRALADDLAFAAGAGWALEALQPVDMFPHTAHIEAVALLRLKRG